jgi:hypothetical protein
MILPKHPIAHHAIERFFATSEERVGDNTMVVGKARSRWQVQWYGN